MKQLIQNLKTGKLSLEEAPLPVVREGFIIVENVFSLISPGTEKSTIETAKLPLLGKAKKRPDLVKQVLNNLRKEGIFATLQKINTRLAVPKALGYSSCGVVLETAAFSDKFRKGDRVACAGQDYASHAEIVLVPQNLVAKIPDNVSFQEASFTTIGAIALHGVRQLEPKIGEKVCVIGLGLIGQITAQILKAAGCSVFGIDTSGFAVEIARKLNIDRAENRNDPNLFSYFDEFTRGYGFDKVIITASVADNDPIIVATEILRKKGLIVVVGNVIMNIPREPHFYKKELELKISTSYGPGRYDPLYEEAGLDYPYAYVRFTENRNLETFLELLGKGSVDVKPLITHTFDFENALNAYDLVVNRNEDYMGILLKYKDEQATKLRTSISLNNKPAKQANIGFIGAGNFAQSYILPWLKKMPVSLDSVATLKGINAVNVARKFGFNTASSRPEEIISNDKINIVFIVTTHETHAKYACLALNNKKDVFVEKPLALNLEELKNIVSAYKDENILLAGFNRRFAPASRLIKDELQKINRPLVMNFRINAGYIPNEHWIQDKEKGGGRIIAEVCHFIDLMLYFSSSFPKKVFASSIDIDSNKWRRDDNIAVNLEFENGSLGNIIYTACGSAAQEKERIEIFAAGNSFLIEDFKNVVLYSNSRKRKIKASGKGHKEEIEQFINAAKSGKESPIDFKSLIYTSLATLKTQQSLNEGNPQIIDISELY